MRILVDIRHLAQKEPSGVGQYSIQLLNALFEIDQENEYVLFSSGRVKPDISTFHVKTPNKILNLRTLILRNPTINWYIREPIDLIWLPNLNITALPTDIPVVLTLHDLSWKIFPQFYSRKMQLWHKATRPHELITRANQILVPSIATAEDVERTFHKPLEQIHAIPHGIDPIFHPKMQARDHGVRSKLHLPKRFALFVGTIEPRKNVLALIEAMKDYRATTRDDIHLVLAGKWGWRSHDVKRRLWKNDTKGWVHQLGYIKDEDRGALYRSTEVLIWPSLYEGFGLPVLEAMASGTPVITSHTSSLPELTHDSAILVDPYNSHDITDALKGVLSSQPLQDQLIRKGLERAQDFCWEVTAKKTMEVFRKTNQQKSS